MCCSVTTVYEAEAARRSHHRSARITTRAGLDRSASQIPTASCSVSGLDSSVYSSDLRADRLLFVVSSSIDSVQSRRDPVRCVVGSSSDSDDNLGVILGAVL